MAERPADVQEGAGLEAADLQPGPFERDTAVVALAYPDRDGDPAHRLFGATVSERWRAGRGPHGGYIAAIVLRALIETVADPQRSPRSLTIHYARAPEPGAVQIATVIERAGRSLSTLSARLHQDGSLIALALAAFSVPWSGPEVSEIEMPVVDGPDPVRRAGGAIAGAPSFTSQIVLQPRLGGPVRATTPQPMEFGGWLGLAETRPIDALSLAFFCDALIPTPFMATRRLTAAPTIDLTIHFRAVRPAGGRADPHELCLARARARLLREGFFEEDTVIWAADGTVLAQSRQLAILLAEPIG